MRSLLGSIFIGSVTSFYDVADRAMGWRSPGRILNCSVVYVRELYMYKSCICTRVVSVYRNIVFKDGLIGSVVCVGPLCSGA